MNTIPQRFLTTPTHNPADTVDPSLIIKNMGFYITEIKPQEVRGKVDIGIENQQLYGMLHGGALCVVIETLGSIGSNLMVRDIGKGAVGQSLNVSYCRPGLGSYVEGVATLLHAGRKTHVWDTKIYNEKDEIVCVGRLTTAIIDKPKL